MGCIKTWMGKASIPMAFMVCGLVCLAAALSLTKLTVWVSQISRAEIEDKYEMTVYIPPEDMVFTDEVPLTESDDMALWQEVTLVGADDFQDGDRQAYAFFVVPDTEHLSEVAEERLRIIMDMDYLGAGFQVAMEDLRLRGAGNILGEVQSGHMGRVGLDLYLEMLEEAVARLKGTPVTQDVETELNLGLPAHIPQSYIEDGRERLRCYKALTSATSGAAREEVALSMRDRFGSFPQELVNFIAVLDFKQFLSHLQVQRADIYLDHVRLVWGDGQTAVQPERILQLVASMKGARMLPPASLMLPLPADKDFAQGLQGLRQALENIRTPGSPGGTA